MASQDDTVIKMLSGDNDAQLALNDFHVHRPFNPQNRDNIDDIHMSISTAFHPGQALDSALPDLVIEASDSVFFYVHTQRLLSSSSNSFKSLLGGHSYEDSCMIQVSEPSSVINIVLHAIYGLLSEQFRPSASDVIAAVLAMQSYGLSILAYLARGTPMFSLVLSIAPARPLECFTLAAAHDLEDLAIAVSPYTLNVKLSDLTDEIAMRIDPIYLRRLFFLHLGRIEALERILLPPPSLHSPDTNCDAFEQQQRLQNAWTLAIGSLTWEPRPGISNGEIDSALRPLGDHLTCAACRRSLLNRVREVLVQWSFVKVRSHVVSLLILIFGSADHMIGQGGLVQCVAIRTILGNPELTLSTHGAMQPAIDYIR